MGGKTIGLHIGRIVEKELRSQRRSAAWLAEQLSCTRSNIYGIFARENIDVELLIRLSLVLRHNFLQDVSIIVQGHISSSDSSRNP